MLFTAMFRVHIFSDTCKRKNIFNSLWKMSPPARCLALPRKHLLVNMDSQAGVAILKLNRPPVNSLNTELLTELKATIEQLEGQDSVRGLILTSTQRTFCAGGDLMEFYNTNADRISKFYDALQDVWITLAGTKLVTVAAINGHSVGSGCMLSISCDYRLMVPDFTIGYPESIPLDLWFLDTMKCVIGHRQTELCCQKGLMMTTDQAFNIGLIDEIVPQDILLEKASQELKSWLRFNDPARVSTRSFLRKDMINKLLATRENITQSFVKNVTDHSVQRTLQSSEIMKRNK